MTIIRPVIRDIIRPVIRSVLDRRIGLVQGTATGGTITEVDGYKIHVFDSSDDFVVTGTLYNAEYDHIAGGGGAGSRSGGGGGGGGAGGYLTGTLALLPVGTYPIVIGAGGPGGADSAFQAGGDGSDTTGFGLTAKGGGGGGGGSINGRVGGSGGGGSTTSGGTLSEPGAGTSEQGFIGGVAAHAGALIRAAGGGGGAGGAGGDAADASTPGIGGAGVVSTKTGSSVTYCQGGRGNRQGTAESPVDRAANTGNGGDATITDNTDFRRGGNGGSGRLVVRYPISI